ncbi:MAG: long-chain fatty acid--CoA ligase [Actinomycetes bacterium]
MLRPQRGLRRPDQESKFVQEISVPVLIQLPTSGNLTDLIAIRAINEPARILFNRASGAGWEAVTATQFESEVRSIAKGLSSAVVQPGDRVALMSRTSFTWSLLEFSIWFAGATVVPIYETSSAEQVDWILNDSGAVALFVESAEHLALVAAVRPSTVAHLWCIDSGDVATVKELGAGVNDAAVATARATLQLDSLATLIYTSGTTGQPKGCELTHANFFAQVQNVTEATADLFFRPDASTLLFIPLAHVFGRMIGVGSAYSGLTLAHCSDAVKDLPRDLASFKPRFILTVPRVFEKVYNGAEARAEAGGKGDIFRKAAAVAIEYSEGISAGKISLVVKIKHALFEKLVYSKIRAGLGGNVTHAISGGAALGARLGHFYRGIGVTVLEGYGLTETTAGATLNTTKNIRVGSVGRPIPGTSIRIADDGEVHIKGPIVFRGYWKNPEATKETFTEDGWFKSGDLGRLDDDGFLYIVGRKKEIIVTSGGKNVAPAVLEDRLRAHPLVSQCVVVGDAKPFIGALVTIDQDALAIWASAQGKSGATLETLRTDPALVVAIQGAVDEANKAVSKAEAIRKFSILPVDLTIASGHLTPKMSIKRNVVIQDFAAEIESIYSGE